MPLPEQYVHEFLATPIVFDRFQCIFENVLLAATFKDGCPEINCIEPNSHKKNVNILI